MRAPALRAGRVSRIFFRALLAGTALTAAAVGCGGGSSSQAPRPGAPAPPAAEPGRVPPSAPPAPTSAALAEGERLFNANCSRCHGARATGTSQGPPLVDIIYEPNHHSDAAFQRAAAQGVRAHHWNFGDMPPVPGVSPEEVATTTAYIRWLQREAGIGVP